MDDILLGKDGVLQKRFVIKCRLVGVTHGDSQEAIGNLKVDTCIVKRDTGNIYDKNAVMILSKSRKQLGWIPRDKTEKLAAIIDSKKYNVSAKILQIVGDGERYNFGVDVQITATLKTGKKRKATKRKSKSAESLFVHKNEPKRRQTWDEDGWGSYDYDPADDHFDSGYFGEESYEEWLDHED